MKKTTASVFLIFTFCFLLLTRANAQNFTVREIMRDPSMAGMRVESEDISPDGKYVIFAWNAEGKEPRNLYMVPTTGGEPRILVEAEKTYEARPERPESKLNYGLEVRDEFSKAREKNLGGVQISPDSKRILFSQNSDIYILDLTDKLEKPRRITRTQGFEGGARWLDDDRIMYSSMGNYYVLNLKETSLIQITKEANPQAFVSIFNVTPNETNTFVAYTVSDGSKQRALFVPNYLGEFTSAPQTRRGFTEQKVYVTPLDGSRDNPAEIKLPRAEGVSYLRSVKWSFDNNSLIVDRVDKDLKRRQLFFIQNAGKPTEKVIMITEENDPKWIGGLSRLVEPNPNDPSQILFGSERDGYNHLYLATMQPDQTAVPNTIAYTNNVAVKQLTTGNYEIEFAKWRKPRNEVVFSSTEANTAERLFYVIDARTGKKTEVPAGEKGMKISAQLVNSADSTYIIYEGSQWNQPSEVYAQKICPECRGQNLPVKLTNSTPAAFKQIKWNAPQFIDIPAKDGKPIKSKIYLPANFDKTKKYPMVIFVHGAGYLQNTINGWNNYYREFMFNEMLTTKGYVILDIDYRGSAGYGRDWRTDVFDFLGGLDYQDHLDAIDYMVKNYAVNQNKIGVYGGSYGGFMAEMLVFRAPEKIAAAAALRPVADWKNYYASSPVYTAERLGFPEKNPEGYKRSSPIAYAEGLRKPLLILHGLVDDNVHAQDSIQLTEKLVRLEKTDYFDVMLYPSESHGFTRPTSWTDEYSRILSFFEKHLK